MMKWEDRKDFKSCVLMWAEKLEVKIQSVYLRPMKNKWASCSSCGHLNFNDELLNIERHLGEYVIVHELLHLRTPNHGTLWKSYMNTYMSGWEDMDKKLGMMVTKFEISESDLIHHRDTEKKVIGCR
ncbi:MAG: YgjP-like metallopeptidase domain-containing protein [Nitrospirota bacterium]